MHQGREQYRHRVVVEIALGRPLRSDETVHHLNGKKDDNRLANLEVLSTADHSSLHWTEGIHDDRVRRQTLPPAQCSACSFHGRLYAHGTCKRCYHREYGRRRRAAKRGTPAH